MRKEEFFRQLEYLLQDIPDAELDEAMTYYRDYLEEAGPENEEAVLREFGSPERIASIIRSDLNGNLEDGGSFTEKGYEDERFRDPNYQLANRLDLPEENGSGNRKSNQNHDAEYVYEEKKEKPRTSGCLKLALIAILLVVASPFLFGAGWTVFGIAVAVIVVAAVLFFVAGLLTVVFLFASLVILGAGFASLVQNPVEAVFVIGLGLVFLGLSLAALVFSVWFYGKLIPWIFRGIGRCLDAVSDRVRRRR